MSSARGALARGAPEAASIAIERAAELSENTAGRAARLVAAADAAWTAGRADRVPGLLDRAAALVGDSRTRARASFVRGRYETRRGDVRSALTLLLAAAAPI